MGDMDLRNDVDFQAVKKLLWGNQVRDELFKRWSQGFTFSADEPTALTQKDGGPCAVIAPVQAFLIKSLLEDPQVFENNTWRSLPQDKVDAYFIRALVSILHQAAMDDPVQAPETPASSQKQLKLQAIQQSEEEPMEVSSPLPASAPEKMEATVTVPPQYCLVFLRDPVINRFRADSDAEAATSDTVGRKTEQEIFHRNLLLWRLETIEQVENALREKLDALKGPYGILQFLYSVILTRSISKLLEEISEVEEEVIDPTHGHGGQSLINLMLTGRGVNYVWDGDQDAGGLKLKGIERQSEVGFLTLLERLRYCEVGTFLKSPKFPIWVVASETHLTVLFSPNMELVSPETPSEAARRVFGTFDTDGSNFISAALLGDVMCTLGLFADAEYVEVMKRRLDPETLGIILLNTFMDEFFPNEKSSTPCTFLLYHYNGLQRASSTNKVVYHEGQACLLESDIRSISDDNAILTCLQTKWPSIDIQWSNGVSPSIN